MTVYYVATDGDNGNNGLSTLTPWKDIEYATSAPVAGDTVNVLGGSYHETVNITISGTLENPITYRAYQSKQPIIDGEWDNTFNGLTWPQSAGALPGTSKYIPMVRIDADYIIWDGIDIIRSDGRGLQFNPKVIGSQALNCLIHTIYNAGVQMDECQDIIVDGIEIHTTTRMWSNPSETNGPVALLMWKSDNTLVQNMLIHDNDGEGATIGTGMTNTTFQDNILYDNDRLNLLIQRAVTATIQRNLLYYTNVNNTHSNIVVADEDNFVDPSSKWLTIINNLCVGGNYNFRVRYNGTRNLGLLDNAYIAHNTFVEATITGVRIDDSPDHLNTILENNLILQVGGTVATVAADPELTFRSNLWSRTTDPNASGIGDVVGNPNLVNPVQIPSAPINPADYALQVGSPAIDAGTTLTTVIKDYFGATRSTPPDIGFHEFVLGEKIMPIVDDLTAVEVSLRQLATDATNQADAVALVIAELEVVDDVLDAAADVIVAD